MKEAISFRWVKSVLQVSLSSFIKNGESDDLFKHYSLCFLCLSFYNSIQHNSFSSNSTFLLCEVFIDMSVFCYFFHYWDYNNNIMRAVCIKNYLSFSIFTRLYIPPIIHYLFIWKKKCNEHWFHVTDLHSNVIPSVASLLLHLIEIIFIRLASIHYRSTDVSCPSMPHVQNCNEAKPNTHLTTLWQHLVLCVLCSWFSKSFKNKFSCFSPVHTDRHWWKPFGVAKCRCKDSNRVLYCDWWGYTVRTHFCNATMIRIHHTSYCDYCLATSNMIIFGLRLLFMWQFWHSKYFLSWLHIDLLLSMFAHAVDKMVQYILKELLKQNENTFSC